MKKLIAIFTILLIALTVYAFPPTPPAPSSITGNAATATSLAANGSNCSAGYAPLGVDASGAAESCTQYQAYDADLTTWAGISPSANVQTFVSSTDYATARTNLGLGTIATQNADAINATGGNINNTTIGGTTPAAGTFTNLKSAPTVTTPTMIGNTTPVNTTTDGTFPTSSKTTINKTGAFTNAAVGNLILITGGTGATTGQYRLTTRTSADSVVVDRNIHASGTDITDGAFTIYKNVVTVGVTDGTNGQMITGWSHQNKPTQLGGSTLVTPPNTPTATGDSIVFPGQKLWVSDAANQYLKFFSNQITFIHDVYGGAFVSVTPATTAAINFDNSANKTSATPTWNFYDNNVAQTGSSAAQVFFAIKPIYNQTSTSAGTDLLINRTETAVGSGTQRLISAGTGGGTYVEKFGVDNTGKVTSSGEMIDTHYDTIFIPASAMTPTATNGAVGSTVEYATNDINMDYLLFDGATEQFAEIQFPMPENWDRSTIKFKVYWSSDTGSTANDTVEWEVACGALSDSDAIDAALGTAQVISDVLLADNGTDLQTSGATPAITVGGTPALGDMVHCKTSRNVGGTDDMTENARLFGVWLQYKADKSVAAW